MCLCDWHLHRLRISRKRFVIACCFVWRRSFAAKSAQFALIDQQNREKLNTEVSSRISNCSWVSFHYCFWSIACWLLLGIPFPAPNEELGEISLLCAPADTNWLWLAFLELINFSKRRQKSNFGSLHTEKSIKSPGRWKMGLKIEKNSSKNWIKE